MANSNEIIKIGQIEIKFLLEASDTNGQSAMFEFLVPPGVKVPLPHYHENYDEIVYGLEGVITFNVDGKITELKPAEILFIKRGAVHGFNNFGQEAAKALTVVTPGLIGPEYFREVGEIVNAGGPPDIEKMKLVFKKHGLVPVMNK